MLLASIWRLDTQRLHVAVLHFSLIQPCCSTASGKASCSALDERAQLSSARPILSKRSPL